MISLNPIQWTISAVVLASIVGGGLTYRASLIADGEAIGYEACQAEHRKNKADAEAKQSTQNDSATKEVIVTETVTETKYKDRIKEVIRYVPTPGTACPADADFVRMFNDPTAR